eukprot:Amastigsp_a508957_22.p4 type:complete len:115 gc:universal Amastigsp_a508957_22:2275-2619(+)
MSPSRAPRAPSRIASRARSSSTPWTTTRASGCRKESPQSRTASAAITSAPSSSSRRTQRSSSRSSSMASSSRPSTRSRSPRAWSQRASMSPSPSIPTSPPTCESPAARPPGCVQ